MLIQARGKASEDITNKSRRILNVVGRRLKVSLASRLGPPLSGRLGVSSAPGQAYRSRWAECHVCDKARRMRYTSTPSRQVYVCVHLLRTFYTPTVLDDRRQNPAIASPTPTIDNTKHQESLDVGNLEVKQAIEVIVRGG